MTGRVLAINTGSTSTKIGFFDSGIKLFEQNIVHGASVIARYGSVMEQDRMRRDAITDFLSEKGIELESIDIVMARGGLITPVRTGVYEVNQEMKDALVAGRDGVHACNLSALIADEIAVKVNEARAEKKIVRTCHAYIADPPMADEMIPEAKMGGLPEYPRRTLFHALNSRAMVRKYAASVGKTNRDVTVIVAHLGGGTSVSLHEKGLVIDTNDALGGDGPMSPERAGTVPAFPLIDRCFSGKYSIEQIKKRLVGRGGAVAYFGTNDFREIVHMAENGDEKAAVFIDAYCLSVSKYIAGLSVDVFGKVDCIILTGGIAYSRSVVSIISKRVAHIADVVVYPGENELESLAENGYGVLSGKFSVKVYDPNKLV